MSTPMASAGKRKELIFREDLVIATTIALAPKSVNAKAVWIILESC
jgi:hypothetical protein